MAILAFWRDASISHGKNSKYIVNRRGANVLDFEGQATIWDPCCVVSTEVLRPPYNEMEIPNALL